MTKADLVNEIAKKTGVERVAVLATVEAMMASISDALERDESVYLRGFGSFVNRTRAKKVARNISKGVAMEIPAHRVPTFKPSKSLVARVKDSCQPSDEE
ncbi:MAG: integration host factor subunit beta [Bacteroidetes bacterium]|nr:MAG: integration host factor subunit beta [Bacteroidota bacterium]